jgi:peptidyl-dipeptidase Dcp
VVRDYVELPSQLMEHWLSTREALDRFARHYETGEPMPADLVERIKRAETFNQGFQTVEYLSAALIDMKLHQAGDTPIDPDTFERKTLVDLGMPHEIVMRHRTPQFMHIFSGDSYSAGYYSYLWADKLVADTWEAFQEAGSPWDPVVAARLRDNVLSAGNSVDPDLGYRAFRGHDATVEPLLRKRGFPLPVATPPPAGN